ncbi:MAG: restriction endonuclease subunit S [Oscillospiraceae bacterium]|nr:restriction endonuclease subunit S [Oscillospiraceae bacterium]
MNGVLLKKWSEVVSIVSGKNQKFVADSAGEYPIYGSGGIMGYANNYLCEAGTTIVGRKGTINNPIFVNEKFWNVDTAFGITPSAALIPKYLYYFCVQFNFKELDKSTTIPSLAKRDLLNIEIPVPPLPEQERIVARIEELFSELDKAVETLKKTKAQLAVYRQAVLKEAFDFGSAEITEIQAIVDDIRIGPFGTMLHKSDYIENGIPVINPQHIKNLSVFENMKISVSDSKAKELSAYRLKNNDIIMGRRGEMGRTAAITEREHGWICGTGSILFRLKPDYDAGFYAQILSSPSSVHYLEENATGTTMKNLNEDIVKHIPVPKITKDMQTAITKELDAKLSVCDSIEKTIDTALQEAEALRQSVLKEAFEGGL